MNGLALILLVGLLLWSVGGCTTAGEQPTQTFESSMNAALGRASRADVLQRWGPPAQRLTLDGDEFWIYRQVQSAPLFPDTTSKIAGALSAFGSAMTGTSDPVYERRLQEQVLQGPTTRLIILRFDGRTGRLKAWSVRE